MPVCLVLALALSGSPPAPEARYEAGRQAFERGLEALDANRLDAAIVDFEASIEARESPPALYNLGLALRRRGRLAEALEAFERFLDLSANQERDGAVRHALALAEELRASLARLTVAIEGPAKSVSIDGRALDPSMDRFGLVLDPGPHTLVAVAEDGRRVERRAALARGARLDLVVDLAASQPLLTASASAQSRVESVGPSPWWWVGLGVGLAVVATSAAAVVAATHNGAAPGPAGGTTGIVLSGLRGR